jgi:hypothetical protein
MTCSSCGKPECDCGSQFTSIDEVSGGLVRDLTCAVDFCRDLKTQLGARIYEVRLIWTRWTGGERGVGEEFVFREEKIAPTPKVADMTDLSKELTEIGLTETGNFQVSEISPRYSEKLLLGLIDEKPAPADVNFYWEIALLRSPESKVIRRRFFPSAPPALVPTQFQWIVKLVRAHSDRTPEGLPRG